MLYVQYCITFAYKLRICRQIFALKPNCVIERQNKIFRYLIQKSWQNGVTRSFLLLGVWASSLVAGFALLYLPSGRGVSTPGEHLGFVEAIYMSGATFFTLGLGDVVPNSNFTRALTVMEAGMGFGFLAVLIGRLPSLNQSFSRRGVTISLLDAPKFHLRCSHFFLDQQKVFFYSSFKESKVLPNSSKLSWELSFPQNLRFSSIIGSLFFDMEDFLTGVIVFAPMLWSGSLFPGDQSAESLMHRNSVHHPEIFFLRLSVRKP